jgi:uncharacterized SAM-binding protein YcdF (DUF218 family)
MFFILSKTLYFIAMPITWIIGLLVLSLFLKNAVWRRKCQMACLALLLLLSNPFLVNELYLWWEVPPTPFRTVGQYDVGIVLTGYTNDGKSPKDRVYMNEAADRLLYALRLYKEGKLKKIMICGREVDLYANETSTTVRYTSKDLLLQAGVPDTAIIVEPNSRNTRENALFAQKLINSQEKLLLISSAFHLRRAKACFQQVGIKNIDVFSANFYARDRIYHPIAVLMPTEDAINKWGRLVHELIGFVVYRLMGYC